MNSYCFKKVNFSLKSFFLLFFLVVILSFSYAEELVVKEMRQESELEFSFDLRTNLALDVYLDCQSFIQGLRIEDKTFLLSPRECFRLHERVKTSLEGGFFHCISLSDEIEDDYYCGPEI